jgi:signal transduction histidine kinase
MKDSLYGPEKFKQLQLITLNEQQRQQEIEQDQERYRNKIKYIILFIVLSVFLLISFLLFRNNRQQQKAKAKIEEAYTELKETQQQLIQREKMASLGELTAGIAHEIQNPLNFVNNFSEVNTELIDEMKEGLQSGKTDEVIALAEDVKQNNIKIVQHGKRAESIVKGMLQHSRNSSGQKEPTDINALADECLRLSYHGMRAKDPRDSANRSFNAKTETHFDISIPPVTIASQEIGRVILNLLTNAFYSVMQKSKIAGDAYEPVVIVRTAMNPGSGDRRASVSISIRDNGNGISQKALDKIFQPFFTTKPTGEGTGLGLSMSYDIITKGHGGELKVETKEGEFAEFIIILPI